MNKVYHALMLNLHQPPNNFDELALQGKDWEVKEILYALDRIPRALWDYDDVARVHLSFSGSLLEALSNPDFQAHMYGVVKLGDMLWHYQNTRLFEIVGTGHYHPVFPLIPRADWYEQLHRWQGVGHNLFNRSFQGFWPPEMGFCMEMIPVLKKFGYRYVFIDSENIQPIDDMNWEEVRYQPHIAEYEGDAITVIVRDRELSNAQEAGADYDWFMNEMHERTKHCRFEPLVTTCSDGENGGWFRNTSENGNFWGVLYREICNRVRAGKTEIQPTFISDYLDKHEPVGRVTIRNAAWNTGWHSGEYYTQWTGSPLQKDALRRVKAVSEDLHQALDKFYREMPEQVDAGRVLEEVHWRVLRAETSCNFFWGEDWVYKTHRDLDDALRYLSQFYTL